MKKIKIAISLILSIIVLCGCDIFEEENQYLKGPYAEIIRMDHSVENDNGKKIAEIYFEKPKLSDDTNSNAIEKINNYFDNEYKYWLNGKECRLNFFNSGTMEQFSDNLSSMKESFGDEALEKSPLQYTVNTQVVFKNDDIISINEFVRWSSGGPIDFHCFGSTFDLKTGELLPFTYFHDVDADEFRNDLSNFMTKDAAEFYYDRVSEMLSPNNEHDFHYEYDDHKYDMSYDYYYDGTDICLTLNQTLTHSGYVVKWNGKTGNDFQGTKWTYNKTDGIIKFKQEENSNEYASGYDNIKIIHEKNESKADDGTILFSAHADYPEIFMKNQQAANAINEYYTIQKEHILEFLAFKNVDAETEYNDHKNNEDWNWLGYSSYLEASVKYQNDKFISFYNLLSVYYNHAAHSNICAYSPTFSTETGEMLSIDDIFTDGFKEFAKEYTINDLQQRTNNGEVFWKNYKDFTSERIEKMDINRRQAPTWYLNENGFVLYFNPYEIACFADGFIEVEIPWKLINQYIKTPET